MRGKIAGTAERPRLAVFRSNMGIYAQLIDDRRARRSPPRAGSSCKRFKGTKTDQAARSASCSPRREEGGRRAVVFDRGGYLYHGRVKALADGAREGGLSFDSVEREVFAREETRELKERVVEINRVAKVVKGGRRFSFTALVVIGDEVDRVGVGYGKAREVPLAISKAVDDAKKNMFTVPKHGTTITHEIIGRSDAARVLLRPASEGTGVIAGGGVRAVLELAGIRDILAKSLGTTNPINMLKATVNGLQNLRRPEDVARIRGQTIAEVLPCRRRARRPRTPARGGAGGRRRGARRLPTKTRGGQSEWQG